MFTPMQLQYLVGLCCLRQNPGAVDITIGDMVLDDGSEKNRDVDVTVTLEDGPGILRAFKAYEVKREKRPLDVTIIEQLCIKLKDMPSITHPAVVSASGFTAPAIKKAERHGVELYKLSPWTRPVAADFPNFAIRGTPQSSLRFGKSLLYWSQGRSFNLVAPNGPESFKVQDSTPLLTENGNQHPEFSNIGVYKAALLMRSTNILYSLEPAQTLLQALPPTVVADPEPKMISPPWSHTHTLDVTSDGVHLSLGGRIVGISQVTISGHLFWESLAQVPEYHILESIPEGNVFAGAAVATGLNDDELFVIIIVPESETAGVHRIRLSEQHRNAIRNLKLEIPLQ